MKLTIEQLIQLSAIFTPRQLDILYGDIGKLSRQPDKWELRVLVNKCNELADFDTLSLLNSRFDLSDIFDTGEMDPVSPEKIAEAEKTFVAFMKSINPDFEMPGGNNDG